MFLLRSHHDEHIILSEPKPSFHKSNHIFSHNDLRPYMQEAYSKGLASAPKPEDLLKAAHSALYIPSYDTLHPSQAQNDSEGVRIMRNPQTNRGLLFDNATRASLCIRGSLPPCVSSVQVELDRVRSQFDRISNPLDKYIYLMALQVFATQCCCGCLTCALFSL